MVSKCGRRGDELLASVISSSLADMCTGTSTYRKSCDIVEIRCDWAATHTALQKDIDPSSEILLKSVRESDRGTQKSRMNYDALVTTSIINATTANIPFDKIFNQFSPFLLPMINFLKIHFNIIPRFLIPYSGHHPPQNAVY